MGTNAMASPPDVPLDKIKCFGPFGAKYEVGKPLRELETRHLNEMTTKVDIEIIRKEMAEIKAELVRWVIGAGFLQTVLIAALLMKLIK